MASMYKRGWFNDSARHSLAAKGISTSYRAYLSAKSNQIMFDAIYHGKVYDPEHHVGDRAFTIGSLDAERVSSGDNLRVFEKFTRMARNADDDAWQSGYNERLKKLMAYYQTTSPAADSKDVGRTQMALDNTLDRLRKNEARQRAILGEEPSISEVVPVSKEHGDALHKKILEMNEEYDRLEKENVQLKENAKFLSDALNPPEEDKFFARKTTTIDMDGKSYKLVNAENEHKEHPKTFELPKPKGEFKFARLNFIDKDGRGERMWVKGVDGPYEGWYEGKLDNKPVVVKDVRVGQRIMFQKKHMYDYMAKKKSGRTNAMHAMFGGLYTKSEIQKARPKKGESLWK